MASRITTFIIVLIVAGTLVAGLIVGAQRDVADGPVDLIITNGRVYTADGSGTFAEAVAVRGNKILRVGSNREIKRLRRPQTMTVDAHGATVLPGFNDSHVHALSGGLSLEHLDLLGATSLDSIQAAIREYAAAHPDRLWVRGRGWYYEPFPGGLPTRQQLDLLVPDRPAYFISYDGHTGWANSKALEAAGVTRKTPSPRNGVVVKDSRTGEPTGALKESAMALMARVLPEPTRDERLAALQRAIERAHENGITSIQNASGSVEELELYDELRQRGTLDLRVYAALSASPGLSAAEIAKFEAARTTFADDPVLKAGAIKLMLDGVVESHTAALLEPYANRATNGHLNFTTAELDRVVSLLDKSGWQIFIHAIGDRGVRIALDAFEHAQAANPPPARGRRHRIEHIETIDPADIPRFASLGVIAAQQPYHGSPDPNQIDLWMTNLGETRANRGWLYHSLLTSGARVVFGSDWPVVPLDPRLGLHVATSRTSPGGVPDGGWIPTERLTLAQSVDAYTSAGAWGSFDELRKGTLKSGMLADIVVLTSDIFAGDARVLDTQVALTIFDGRIVFDREQAEKTE
jgi:predicted amidohydrolase YtcJ